MYSRYLSGSSPGCWIGQATAQRGGGSSHPTLGQQLGWELCPTGPSLWRLEPPPWGPQAPGEEVELVSWSTRALWHFCWPFVGQSSQPALQGWVGRQVTAHRVPGRTDPL